MLSVRFDGHLLEEWSTDRAAGETQPAAARARDDPVCDRDGLSSLSPTRRDWAPAARGTHLVADLAASVGPDMLVLANAGCTPTTCSAPFAATGADLAWRIGVSVSVG